MSGAEGRARTFAPKFRFDPVRAARQGRATKLAIDTLGAQSALQFLNTNHIGLGMRPIDHAGESDDGLARVEVTLANLRNSLRL